MKRVRSSNPPTQSCKCNAVECPKVAALPHAALQCVGNLSPNPDCPERGDIHPCCVYTPACAQHMKLVALQLLAQGVPQHITMVSGRRLQRRRWQKQQQRQRDTHVVSQATGNSDQMSRVQM